MKLLHGNNQHQLKEKMSMDTTSNQHESIYYMKIIQGVEILPGFVLVLFQELLEPEYSHWW